MKSLIEKREKSSMMLPFKKMTEFRIAHHENKGTNFLLLKKRIYCMPSQHLHYNVLHTTSQTTETNTNLVKKLVYATERFFHNCFLLGLNYFLMYSTTFEFCQGYENIFLENRQV